MDGEIIPVNSGAYVFCPTSEKIMAERKTITTTLLGGVADGEVVVVASGEQALSLPRLGNGYAVYFRCPDGCYRFVDTSAKVVGREVEP